MKKRDINNVILNKEREMFSKIFFIDLVELLKTITVKKKSWKLDKN